jgi:hypothetical protein
MLKIGDIVKYKQDESARPASYGIIQRITSRYAKLPPLYHVMWYGATKARSYFFDEIVKVSDVL